MIIIVLLIELWRVSGSELAGRASPAQRCQPFPSSLLS